MRNKLLTSANKAAKKSRVIKCIRLGTWDFRFLPKSVYFLKIRRKIDIEKQVFVRAQADCFDVFRRNQVEKITNGSRIVFAEKLFERRKTVADAVNGAQRLRSAVRLTRNKADVTIGGKCESGEIFNRAGRNPRQIDREHECKFRVAVFERRMNSAECAACRVNITHDWKTRFQRLGLIENDFYRF